MVYCTEIAHFCSTLSIRAGRACMCLDVQCRNWNSTKLKELRLSICWSTAFLEMRLRWLLCTFSVMAGWETANLTANIQVHWMMHGRFWRNRNCSSTITATNLAWPKCQYNTLSSLESVYDTIFAADLELIFCWWSYWGPKFVAVSKLLMLVSKSMIMQHLSWFIIGVPLKFER